MKKHDCLASVIIPCYRQAHFLNEAIESALRQTNSNIEIIVIDDGSPDNVREVASRYPQVKYVRQRNQGLSAARNRGIRESLGQYLVFLDSDDRLFPNAIDAGLSSISERPDSAFVWGRYQPIDLEGRPSAPPSNPHSGELYPLLLERNHIAMIATVLWKRDIFDDVGDFNTDVNPAADYDLYLRIARRFPTRRHNEIIAEYRLYDTSMSGDVASMMRAVILTLKSQYEFVRGHAELEKAYRSGLEFWRTYYADHLYYQLGRRIWDLKRCKRNLKDLYHLLKYYPEGLRNHLLRKILKQVA